VPGFGHFDVPDMTEVLHEADEVVEDGLASTADSREFTFANVVRLSGRQNPRLFEGTRVAREAAAVLASSAPARGGIIFGHCERGEAISSTTPDRDCFVALFLAVTPTPRGRSAWRRGN